jgi:hypothetical protein
VALPEFRGALHLKHSILLAKLCSLHPDLRQRHSFREKCDNRRKMYIQLMKQQKHKHIVMNHKTTVEQDDTNVYMEDVCSCMHQMSRMFIILAQIFTVAISYIHRQNRV